LKAAQTEQLEFRREVAAGFIGAKELLFVPGSVCLTVFDGNADQVASAIAPRLGVNARQPLKLVIGAF